MKQNKSYQTVKAKIMSTQHHLLRQKGLTGNS